MEVGAVAELGWTSGWSLTSRPPVGVGVSGSGEIFMVPLLSVIDAFSGCSRGPDGVGDAPGQFDPEDCGLFWSWVPCEPRI